MTETFRSLVVELVEEWDKVEDGDFFALAPLMDRARKALTQPEPEGPTLKEISDWIISEQRLGTKWTKRVDHHDALPVACAAIHAFSRYVPPSPLPVSVSERMPGEGECDKEGRCWWLRVGTDGVGDWTQQTVCTLIQCNTYRLTHWLPYDALPLPEGVRDGKPPFTLL